MVVCHTLRKSVAGAPFAGFTGLVPVGDVVVKRVSFQLFGRGVLGRRRGRCGLQSKISLSRWLFVSAVHLVNFMFVFSI